MTVRITDPAYRHSVLCNELNAIYMKKNADYGDSFHLTYLEEGMAMPRIRLSDKLNRFKTLSRNIDSQQVADESIRDTLLDLANYALMTVMELDVQKNETIEPDEMEYMDYVKKCQEIARRGVIST